MLGSNKACERVVDEMLLKLQATLYHFREFVAQVTVILHDPLETRVVDTPGMEAWMPSPRHLSAGVGACNRYAANGTEENE